MSQKLQGVQWLFLDPSVLLNEVDSDREVRRQIAAALARRGKHVHQEDVERAWMQTISGLRPVPPLIGTAQLLAGDPLSAQSIADEVNQTARNLDTLVTGAQLVLNTLAPLYKVGIIAPYRTGNTRTRLDRFHLNFPVMALSDELNLSHRIVAGGKPDPALFTWALRKVGVPETRVAYAGDRVDLGIAPAKAAGFTTIWVRQTNYKLRYPRSGAETADFTLNAISELVSLVT